MDRAAIESKGLPRYKFFSKKFVTGFTLTEILIALFLVGMFGIALGNLDFFAQGTIRRFDRRLWLAQEPRRLLDWMTADVEKAESMEVYGDGVNPVDWTAPPQPVGTFGTAVKLTWQEGRDTPSDPTDDTLHEVRYTLTTYDPNPPNAAWFPTMPDLVRRYKRLTPPGVNWTANDIVCGLAEERNAGLPTPDTPILKVTGFQVTKTADPGTSQLNPIPQNILRLDIQLAAASVPSQSFQATYYLQSRSSHARKLRDVFLAFLKKRVP